jgi:hypothetical protein
MTALLVYQCSICNCRRGWGKVHVGDVAALDLSTQPVLECARCGHATQHSFVGSRPLSWTEDMDLRKRPAGMRDLCYSLEQKAGHA